MRRESKNVNGKNDLPSPEGVKLKTCSCCKKTLPITQFYTKDKSGRRDSCCHNCRKEKYTRHKEKANSVNNKVNKKCHLITEETDKEKRLAMIKEAERKVKEIFQKKKNRTEN